MLYRKLLTGGGGCNHLFLCARRLNSGLLSTGELDHHWTNLIVLRCLLVPESENAVPQLSADARAECKAFIPVSSDQHVSAVAILLLLWSKHQQQLHLCKQQLRNMHGLLPLHNQVLVSSSPVDNILSAAGLLLGFESKF